ncbi:GAF domain-containing protein [Marivirga sp. S37H4]|uniref:GAF domain-containing protein n=1 Tax=Marivirga aurantiaca TaxID=2802615 RepID=A0A934WZB7_9BACT|nr:GAF domain-containing protein [Marivirga aurantiaca]MBK6265988.1 GAF domain-containing protein [Marivirga aurantiaca]
MKKINFKSIKSRLVIAFTSLILLLIIVVGITLSQVGNVIVIGVKLLDNRQPSRMHVEAMRSGVRKTNVLLQTYLLSGDTKYKQDINDIWENQILPVQDTIDHLKNKWEDTENLILFEKANRLAERIRNNQQEVIEEASFEQTSAKIDITDFPDFRPDSLMDPDALQNWITEEISSQQSSSPDNGALFIDKLNAISTEYDEINQQLYNNLRDETKLLGRTAFAAIDNFIIVEAIVFVLYFIICILLFKYILNKIVRSIGTLKAEMSTLSEGNIPEEKKSTNDELDVVLEELHGLSMNLKNVKLFALEVGKGSFDNDISVFNNEGEIGRSLAEMRDSLKNVSEEAVIRNWSNKGFAEFGDILRKYSNDLATLSEHVVTYMVKYLQANQGSLFIVDKSDDGETLLKLSATYAYDRKKFINKNIEPGQGLVGQVYLEKESIYLKDIPENYVTITSGLGKATPTSLLIVPLKVNDEIFGVIELGSFQELKEHERNFIEKISENIASSIQAVKINEQTRALLDESQQMTEQMRSQEEEMRQNMEELQATQEEMERKQKENKEHVDAIEKSGMAFIEFAPSGEIIHADNIFLDLFGYKLNEIQGRHHRIFVDQKYAQSEAYESFWQDLKKGKSKEGVFERYTKNGNKIFIKGAYVDVKDINGEINRIFKFAIDVTDIYTQYDQLLKEKEQILSSMGQITEKVSSSDSSAQLAEIKSYTKELKENLYKQLRQNEEKLKKSLAEQKKKLGL